MRACDEGSWLCVKRLAAGGRSLYVISSGGSSKDTSCAISARVFTWKDPVRLITIYAGYDVYIAFPASVSPDSLSQGGLQFGDTIDNLVHVQVCGKFALYNLQDLAALIVWAVWRESASAGVYVVSHSSITMSGL